MIKTNKINENNQNFSKHTANDYHKDYLDKTINVNSKIKLFKNQYFQSNSKRNSKSIRMMENLKE